MRHMFQSYSNAKDPEAPKNWHPPLKNHFRLDVDATINERLNLYGIAGVIGNHDGNLVLAFGTRIIQPISVTHEEMLAIKEGLQLVYERGFECTHIYSDLQMAVQAVMNPSSDYGYIGLCAQEIKDRIKLPRVIGLTHMKRSTNLVNGDFSSWLDDLISRNNIYSQKDTYFQ